MNGNSRLDMSGSGLSVRCPFCREVFVLQDDDETITLLGMGQKREWSVGAACPACATRILVRYQPRWSNEDRKAHQPIDGM